MSTENRRVVQISRAAYVELAQALHMLERWTDADLHEPNCILYAGYAQPELRRHMTELVFVPTKERIMITKEQLENWFTYHSPNADQEQAYQDIREAGMNLASVIVARTPTSADQTAALRKVREAVMTANAAIACGGQ